MEMEWICLFNNRGIDAFSLLCASPPVGESKLFNQEIEAKYGRLLAGREDHQTSRRGAIQRCDETYLNKLRMIRWGEIFVKPFETCQN